MPGTFRRAALLGASALALTIAPLAIDASIPFGSGGDIAWAKNTKSGNSSAGHSSSGRGNSNAATPGQGNGNGNGNGHGNGHNPPEIAELEVVQLAHTPPGQDKQKNIHALLGGLNSLQRSLNGLMSSSDPRMEQFREFVIANAEFETAAQTLADYLAVQVLPPAYDGDPSAYPDGFGLAELLARYDALVLASMPGDSAYEAELSALMEVLNSPEVLAYFDSQVGTGDDALMAAIEAGRNPSRTYEGEDLERVKDWIRQTLGVGEFEGTIDELLALWASEAAAAGDVPAPAVLPEPEIEPVPLPS